MTAHIHATFAALAIALATAIGTTTHETPSVSASSCNAESIAEKALSVTYNGAIYSIGDLTGEWTSSESFGGTVLHASGDGPHTCELIRTRKGAVKYDLPAGCDVFLDPRVVTIHPRGLRSAKSDRAPRVGLAPSDSPALFSTVINWSVINKMTYKSGGCWKGEEWDANNERYFNDCGTTEGASSCKLEIQYNNETTECYTFTCGGSVTILRDGTGVTVPDEPNPDSGPCP